VEEIAKVVARSTRTNASLEVFVVARLYRDQNATLQQSIVIDAKPERQMGGSF